MRFQPVFQGMVCRVGELIGMDIAQLIGDGFNISPVSMQIVCGLEGVVIRNGLFREHGWTRTAGCDPDVPGHQVAGAVSVNQKPGPVKQGANFLDSLVSPVE